MQFYVNGNPVGATRTTHPDGKPYQVFYKLDVPVNHRDDITCDPPEYDVEVWVSLTVTGGLPGTMRIHGPVEPRSVYHYPMAAYTADLVILTILGGRLNVLLIERGEAPFAGKWAFPGGHVNLHRDPRLSEDVEDAAHRELEEETSIPQGLCRLVRYGTFATPGRDPRGNYITEAFAAFVSPGILHLVKPGDDAKEVRWFPVDEMPEMAFDHAEILADTLKRVTKDLLTTDIAFDLLPAEFTVGDLHHLAEMVTGKPIDRSNFQRRFTRLVGEGIVRPTGGKRAGARTYRRGGGLVSMPLA